MSKIIITLILVLSLFGCYIDVSQDGKGNIIEQIRITEGGFEYEISADGSDDSLYFYSTYDLDLEVGDKITITKIK